MIGSTLPQFRFVAVITLLVGYCPFATFVAFLRFIAAFSHARVCWLVLYILPLRCTFGWLLVARYLRLVDLLFYLCLVGYLRLFALFTFVYYVWLLVVAVGWLRLFDFYLPPRCGWLVITLQFVDYLCLTLLPYLMRIFVAGSRLFTFAVLRFATFDCGLFTLVALFGWLIRCWLV